MERSKDPSGLRAPLATFDILDNKMPDLAIHHDGVSCKGARRRRIPGLDHFPKVEDGQLTIFGQGTLMLSSGPLGKKNTLLGGPFMHGAPGYEMSQEKSVTAFRTVSDYLPALTETEQQVSRSRDIIALLRGPELGRRISSGRGCRKSQQSSRGNGKDG